MSWDGPLRDIGHGVQEIPADYTGEHGGLEMRTAGRAVASGALLEHVRGDHALEQLANVATLPGIVGQAWAMPDIHLGYGFPIGGVAAFAAPEPGATGPGVVSPGGVGFDINCGVRLLRTGLHVDEVRDDLPGLMDALFATVPAGMGGRGGQRLRQGDMDRVLADGAVWAVEEGVLAEEDRLRLESHGRVAGADPALVSERARLRGLRGLGSLGSGNHFLEVQVVDRTWDEAAARAYDVAEGDVLLMAHTGSRGLGHQVCQEHVTALQGVPARHGIRLVDRQLACAPLGTPEADAYLAAMAAAANYAFVNRSLIAAKASDALTARFPHADVSVVYDVCHNIAKWETHRVDGADRRVLVHRKGATRAFGPGHPELHPDYRDAGQPVIVPGDMGRQSFLLAGRGAEGPLEPASGLPAPFASCCHGAGRRLSRSAAKREFQGADLIRRLHDAGIEVRATSDQVAAEEAPEAYKDVSEVVAAVETAGLAARVARLRPMGVVKG